MENRWGLERKARCKCDFPAGTCASIECPHLLNSRETSSLWIEGWALSKYSSEPYKKTRIGGLIKRIKYDKSPDYSYPEVRDEALKRLSTFHKREAKRVSLDSQPDLFG